MIRILPIFKKEIIEILRDKYTLISLLFLPSLLLFIYGYAISLDVKEIKMSICDKDLSQLSTKLIEKLTASGYFRVVSIRESLKDIEQDIQNSTAQVGIVIYPNFYSDFVRNKYSLLQIIIDGSNAQSSQVILNYLMSALEKFSQQIINEELIRITPFGEQKSEFIIERIIFNPLLKSPFYLLPGLIAFVIMVTGAISTTISIVREKENKTFEQTILCPINPSFLIIGKLLPYFLISLISSTIVILISVFLFELPIKGSIIFLSISIILFLLCALGFGIFISTIASSQQVAFTIAAFSTLLPTIILSGFIFPINNMPKIIQIITYIVPARYFIAIIRGILLKGSSISELYVETLSLIVFASIVLFVSIMRVKSKGLI